MHPPTHTDGELAILRILWDQGPSTVKDLHRVLQQGRELPYTTVLSAVQNMTEKGLLHRDASHRQHVYTAAVAEQATRSNLMDDLVDKAFHGSAVELMVHAVQTGRVGAEDLKALQKLISAKKGGR